MAGMQPEDIYELTGAGDPRISPDGRTVAYAVWSVDREDNSYRGAIWLADVDGATPPRRFTSGQKKDGGARWSPDGTMLAFTSNREKDAPQLYVMPVAGGEPRRLTDLKEGAGELTWSPDGTRIAFTSRVPDPAYEEKDERKRPPRRFTRLLFKLDNEGWTGDRRQHVFVVSVDGSGEPVQLTKGEFDHEAPSWSPDGARIAFVAARHEDWDIHLASDVYVVDTEGGEPECLTATDGSSGNPTWTPDGSRIAYLYSPGVMDDPHHGQVAVVDVQTRERRTLSDSLDRNCAPYPPMREPAVDGGDVVFGLEDSGNVHVYRVPLDGSREPERVTDGDLCVTGFDVHDGVMVHTQASATTFSEVFAGDRRLTDLGDAFKSSHELSSPERFVASSADGTEVECWIMRPAGFEEGKKYPVLLNVHGGPFTQYGNRFFDEFQVATGAGYVVVYCNPRGSSGYTEAWGRAIRGGSNDAGPGWGTVDYEDVMACIDAALAHYDFCDPERLGVIGGSYGGYMTSWIVGHNDRFRAAISERAVNQWVSMWGSSDFGWAFKGEIDSFIWEDFDEWVRMSPQTYATEIHTPLLILHSENDLRCPIEQAEQLFTTLRLLKRDVELVRFPGECHELTRSGSPVHRVQRFEIVLDWWSRKL